MKEAVLSTNKWRELYVQCIRMMRTMYQQCRLVHGDLSEYNILYVLHARTHAPLSSVHSVRHSQRVPRDDRYYKSELYFIDVSQSVEHDHPHALDFLRLVCDGQTEIVRCRSLGRDC
jgi:RIO kinase 1